MANWFDENRIQVCKMLWNIYVYFIKILFLFRFLRKGKIGSFQKEMPEIYIDKFDQEIDKWKAVRELYPK